MTSREWLGTLTDEEFTSWLVDPEIINWNQLNPDGTVPCEEPTPKLTTLKCSFTSSFEGILAWLKMERKK